MIPLIFIKIAFSRNINNLISFSKKSLELNKVMQSSIIRRLRKVLRCGNDAMMGLVMVRNDRKTTSQRVFAAALHAVHVLSLAVARFNRCQLVLRKRTN